ncbi:hypothetical protein SEA_JELLYBONES_82 [Gordonia phage Jellybones]|uniref:Uncharacterized protein n=1 Tax=Gordonia phage Jellybones TaxID=2653716 RepID=A0A5Q2WH52_9CAUD|nr:hypothetical protein HWC76_gp051 [Gordonia phage Jellybones]QGH76224.1 hypothetical protein SEA_JELLYBONES_82 [Gordonia phage Jellybones]
MRITFEMEDDNDDEFRVELFSSRKDLSPDDLIGLGVSVMGNLRRTPDQGREGSCHCEDDHG